MRHDGRFRGVIWPRTASQKRFQISGREAVAVQWDLLNADGPASVSQEAEGAGIAMTVDRVLVADPRRRTREIQIQNLDRREHSLPVQRRRSRGVSGGKVAPGRAGEPAHNCARPGQPPEI